MYSTIRKLIYSNYSRPSDITEEEYNAFYKALTKDFQEPLAKTHFNAEGEVSFKSLLFVPKAQPSDSFNRYGTVTDNIKVNWHLPNISQCL